MNDTEISVELITNTMELNTNVESPQVSLSADTTSAEGAGIIGSTLNGTSVVENTISKLTTSNGIGSEGNDIKLDISECEELNPSELTPAEKEEVEIVVLQEGVTKKITLSNLTFDLTTIRGFDATKLQTLRNNHGVIEWESDQLPAPTIAIVGDELQITNTTASTFDIYDNGVLVGTIN